MVNEVNGVTTSVNVNMTVIVNEDGESECVNW